MNFSLVKPVYAQCFPGNAGSVNLADCIVNQDGARINSLYDTPSSLATVLINNLFVLAGITLFLVILYSGFLMASRGKEGFEDAKKIMTGAITGFLLMFSAYWIVQIISLLTGSNLETL